MEISARLFNYARCHTQVVLCSGCDRGHRYCGSACADTSREESQRAAGQRYQASRRGRHCHAARQQRYRQRQREKVTHQGSPAAAVDDSLPVEPNEPLRQPVSIPARPDESILCQRCARSCSPFVRLGWLRTSTRRFYRARSGLSGPG